MNKYSQFLLTACLVLALVGCSADEEPQANAENGAVAQETLAGEWEASLEPAGDEPPTGDVGIDGIEELWLSTGADAELASCYAEVLRDSNIGAVADLNDLQNAMASLDSDAQLSINACLTSG